MKIKNTIIGFRASDYLKTDLNSIAFENGLTLSGLLSELVWMHLTSDSSGSRVVLKDESARWLKMRLEARIDRRV